MSRSHQGYFQREEETREVYFEEDGTRWWSTGDIGEMYPDGEAVLVYDLRIHSLTHLFCSPLQER
jgi:acyl-CoA synthetase (AMP-forming)/AMP-acid ligase II